MPAWWSRLRRAAALLALVFLTCLLPACSVGPLEISLRGNDGQPDPNVASTVTAVFATNTAIALLRTATAEAPVAVPDQATLPASPTVAPVLQSASSELRLVYSPDSLALINTGSRAEDISGLSLRGSGGELSIASWDNGFLTASLYAFPPGDCLMAWGLNTNFQDKPAACDVRHAWIAVSDQQAVWQTAGTFSVYWHGQPVTECAGYSGVCTIIPPY